MNEQEQAWSGSFGDEYTRRNNKVDWRARIPFWADIMKFTGARSVYEVGCGAGWNLSAIAEASPYKVRLYGSEINALALAQARACGLSVYASPPEFDQLPPPAELVFTAGVLIHVAPDNLLTMMNEIIAASSRYVLAIEYAADAEEMIEYRGESNLLWKRNYGALYEAMGLTLLHTGNATGFDRCTYWLLSKP